MKNWVEVLGAGRVHAITPLVSFEPVLRGLQA